MASCPLPLSDDGKNTWINPVERLGYQVESVRSVLGDFAELQEIRTKCRELSDKPVNAAMRSACDALHGKLWAVVAGKFPSFGGSADQPCRARLPDQTLFRLVRCHPRRESRAAQPGRAGANPALVSRIDSTGGPLRTDRFIGGCKGGLRLPACEHSQDAPVRSGDAKGSGITSLPLQLTVSLKISPLVLKEPLALNRHDLRGTWLVSSPGNQGGSHAAPLRREKYSTWASILEIRRQQPTSSPG